MKLIRHTFFLLLALGLIVGCGNGAVATSPEAAVRRVGFGALEDVQIVGVRYVGERVLVLYTGVDRSPGAGDHIYNLGHTFVVRTSTGWQVEDSGVMGASALPNPAEVLQYSVGRTQTPTEVRTLVVGRALDPRIVSVEAVFDDGRAARDEVTNGVFAVVMIGADEACALRAFDAEGTEIQLPGHIATPLSTHC